MSKVRVACAFVLWAAVSPLDAWAQQPPSPYGILGQSAIDLRGNAVALPGLAWKPSPLPRPGDPVAAAEAPVARVADAPEDRATRATKDAFVSTEVVEATPTQRAASVTPRNDAKAQAPDQATASTAAAAAAAEQASAASRVPVAEQDPVVAHRAADPGVASAAPSEAPRSKTVLDQHDVSRRVAKARDAIKLGRIAEARALLETAVSSLDRDALFLLGQSYDPEALARWGAVGIVGDPDKAAGYYGQASEGGHREANSATRLGPLR